MQSVRTQRCRLSGPEMQSVRTHRCSLSGPKGAGCLDSRCSLSGPDAASKLAGLPTLPVSEFKNILLSVKCNLLRREKNGEAKPRPNNVESGVFSGRLLEDQTHVGMPMVQALPAISAIGGLWGTRCGRWPTLATLTCAV